MATSVLSVELTKDIKDLTGLSRYNQALILVRREGLPIGQLLLPCSKGVITAQELQAAIEANGELCWRIAQSSLKGWLLKNHDTPKTELPNWSIIICSRDRTDDLKLCLDSLMHLNAKGGEILVVDNAPSDDRTERLVAQYPTVRYTRENRPGLNWARTHGAKVATGDVIVYTDDDVIADPIWIDGILEPFSNPQVGAATGLTMPYELENDVQELFEFKYGGFSKGFQRATYDFRNLAPTASDRLGAGANMAFRREIVNRLQIFAVEMDCGTVAKTGGDLYGMYKILAHGYQVVYTPNGLLWHRHRRDYQTLRRTIYNYRVGGMSYLTRCLLEHGETHAIKVGLRWMKGDYYQIKRYLKRAHNHLPWELATMQLRAIPEGISSYFASRKIERALPVAELTEVQPVDVAVSEPLGGLV
jgi:glycosyltransferase involved in cell wall biosynthesis